MKALRYGLPPTAEKAAVLPTEQELRSGREFEAEMDDLMYEDKGHSYEADDDDDD